MGRYNTVKLNIKILGFEILLFLILYQPVIFGITATYYLALIVSVCIFFILLQERRFLAVKRERYAEKILAVLFLAFLYCGLVHYDSYIMSRLILLLTPVMQYWYVMVFQNYAGLSNEQIADALIKTGLFQCMLCILMVIFPDIRQMQLSYLASFGENQIVAHHVEGIRVFGIAGYTQYFFSIGMVHGILSVFLAYRGIVQHRIKDVILAVIMLIPSVFNSRTGAMIAAVCIVFLLAGYTLKKRGRIPGWILPATVMGIFILAISIFVMKYTAPSVYAWWQQAVSVLYDLMMNHAQTRSFVWNGGLMPGNWILPEGIHYLVGTGSIPSAEYAHVALGGLFDSGYVRVIWTGGMFLLMIVIAAYFSLTCMDRNGFARNDRILRWTIFLYLMLGMLKGTVYFTLPLIFLVMVICGCCGTKGR